MKPFCFHELLSNGPFQQRLQRVATNKEKTIDLAAILIHTLLEIQIFFSASVQCIRKFAAAGPGAGVCRSYRHKYIYIYTDGGGGFIDFTSVTLAPIIKTITRTCVSTLPCLIAV